MKVTILNRDERKSSIFGGKFIESNDTWVDIYIVFIIPHNYCKNKVRKKLRVIVVINTERVIV